MSTHAARLVPVVVATVVTLLATGAGTRPPTASAAGQDGVWPLAGRPEVVHGFDPPQERWQPGHRGVDLRGQPGQRVRSALAGRVTFAGRIAGRGIVVVGHGATRTTYQPLVASVRVGEQVAAGSPLGRLAGPGSHCWPAACLHWGLLRGEVYLNPLSLVGVQPVRLLPRYGAVAPAPGDTTATPAPVARMTPAVLAGVPLGGALVAPLAAPVVAPAVGMARLLTPPFMRADAPAGRPAAGGPS